MKIEQLIVQFLYKNKKVTLQDIGVFYLSPDIIIPEDSDKETVLPENAIRFEYNTKAAQDEDLINYIVQQTRKIKPLATSDLESFTILGRQFMNIGKPLPIEGLGILQKNQSGGYEFIQGNSMNTRLEPQPTLLREKEKEAIVFTTPSRKPGNKNTIMAIVVIAILIAGAGIFYYWLKVGKDKKTDSPVVIEMADTTVVPKDTVKQVVITAPDTTKLPVTNPDGYTFKVVIKEYNSKVAAEKALKRLSNYGHFLLMYPKDSSTYIIAMPFKKPAADSLRTRDSIKVLFGGKPYIENR